MSVVREIEIVCVMHMLCSSRVYTVMRSRIPHQAENCVYPRLKLIDQVSRDFELKGYRIVLWGLCAKLYIIADFCAHRGKTIILSFFFSSFLTFPA